MTVILYKSNLQQVWIAKLGVAMDFVPVKGRPGCCDGNQWTSVRGSYYFADQAILQRSAYEDVRS